MTYAKIIGLGTANPDHCFPQMKICEYLAPGFNNRRAPMIFRAAEVDKRYTVLKDPKWLVANPGIAERLNIYNKEAPVLGAKAVQKALDNANLSVDDIDHFIAISCTGVDCPGLDVTIAQAMNMSPFLRRLALVGMGCHALLPGLHQAAAIVTAKPEAKIMVLTIELCTLHFQHDRGIRNILGTALFGDGASAAIVSNGSDNGIALVDSLSFSNYQSQDELAFHPGNHGYKIKLTTRIPDMLRAQVPPLVEKILSRNKLQLTDIKHWIVHPGGMKILDYLEQALELDNNELQYSRAILKEHGNMSSATLLYVLERLIQNANPTAGDYGMMLGFGPGLSIEAGLIQW